MTRLIHWFPCLFSVLTVFGLAAMSPGRTLAQDPAGPPPLDKVKCWFNAPRDLSIDCYHLTVPETRFFDLAVGPGKTLTLPVAIIRRGTGGSPDPVVYLAGGPGDGAWLDADRIDWWWDFVGATDWTRKRDLILFDQRGSGLVEPRIDCPETEKIALALLTLSDEAEAGRMERAAAGACAARLVAEGHNPGAYTSRDIAADLHDLFQALEVPAWNVYGLSYGTRLGLEYMRQYPGDIRGVVLDSVLPPEAQFLEEDAAMTDRAFRMVFNACDEQEKCRIAYGDLARRMTDLVHRLDAKPLVLRRPNPEGGAKIDIVVSDDFLIARLFNLLYNRADIESVPQLIDIYDREITVEIERDIDRYLDDYLGRKDFGDAMFMGVHCQEEVPFNDMPKAIAAYRRYPLLAGLAAGGEAGSFAEVCESWRSALPQLPLHASDNQPVVSDLPALILSGLYDPVTPPVYGRMAAAHLANGFYVEFDGIGHDVLGNDDCANVIAEKFLDDPQAPPRDTCLGESSPPDFLMPIK